ncbi:hypothetical protein [Serinicoccus kebangsaanensis]|uniref:hypothetical protein n=1 Tax=Serinicoccus kebangsaanensis TaxID=2602069 RepID=UPI00124CEFDE|nr:hypothetical protein [Serinicoccus kebangsaanensis]
MVELAVFALIVVLLLALLGRAATPRRDRLPLRQWTPVHITDLVGRGLRVFGDAGKERARRQEQARESVDGRRPEKPERGPLPPPPPNPEDD